ncbi:hypothetical protein [Helicobacter didelphidarum]|uniref:hypothetical protein n=1 Tax=Helicobacter didelphidarum TaxID=2040648 RepID=UPI0015F15128|nr:hypothetical protein [Helicobacter didelphidarum]
MQLEFYKAQREQKKANCNRFIQDWNADRYPCILGDNAKECFDELYQKYCNH